MKKNNEKLLSLAETLHGQNQEPQITCVREIMLLSHLLSRYLEAKLVDTGLNRTQRRILAYILSNGEAMTPTELSKLSFLTIETINKSVDHLDKLGMTKSSQSKTDRRVRKVNLTEKSLEMMERTLPIRREVLSQVTGCLNKEEIISLSGYIERLLGYMKRLTGY